MVRVIGFCLQGEACWLALVLPEQYCVRGVPLTVLLSLLVQTLEIGVAFSVIMGHDSYRSSTKLRFRFVQRSKDILRITCGVMYLH